MSKCVKPECGNKIFEFLDDKELFTCLQPIHQSIEFTEQLLFTHDLYIVTATSHRNIEVKIDWVNKYFPHIGDSKVITCQDKSLINVDLLIDDASHNIRNFPNQTIVLDYAWNRDLDSTFKRAYTWKDVYKIISNMI